MSRIHRELLKLNTKKQKKKSKVKITSAGGDVEKLELCTLLVGMKNGAAAVETSMAVPQKIKNRITCDPAIPLLGLYPKELKAGS